MPAAEQAAGGVSSLLSGGNANPPGGPGASGVADTTTSLAVNPNAPAGMAGAGPSARGVVNTSGYTPFAKYVANEVLAGRMPPEALSKAINLGQALNPAVGPTNTFEAQAERARPRSIGPQETVVLDPTKGVDAPGNVVTSAVDPYAIKTTETLAQGEATDAPTVFKRGLQAQTDQDTLTALDRAYNQVWGAPENEWNVTASSLALQKLSEAIGVDLTRFSSRKDALDAIRGVMQGMIGSARAAQGDPALRGGLDSMLKTLPDPSLAPGGFHFMTEQFKRTLQQQIDDGKAAQTFIDSPGRRSDAIQLHNTLASNRDRARKLLQDQQQNSSSGGESSASPPKTAPKTTNQVDPTAVLADAKKSFATVPQGFTPQQWHDRIVAHAKEKYGVDLGAMGF